MKQFGRVFAVFLAIIAVISLFTDWPWWLTLGFGAPFGFLFLFDDVVQDWCGLDFPGDGGGGGGFDGAGGDGGG